MTIAEINTEFLKHRAECECCSNQGAGACRRGIAILAEIFRSDDVPRPRVDEIVEHVDRVLARNQ